MRAYLRAELARLPGLMRLGLAILAAGGSLDLAYHAAPAAWSPALDAYLGPEGLLPHLVTLLGMIVIMAGVLAEQAQRLASSLGERLGLPRTEGR